MTHEEAKHIVDVAFGIPQAVRRVGEDRTYHEEEIREAKEMAIKALEQQTCEDCISRQAVLDIFANNADAIRPYSKTWEEVKALPSVNPQLKWIPISERLPEDEQEILFSTKTGKSA